MLGKCCFSSCVAYFTDQNELCYFAHHQSFTWEFCYFERVTFKRVPTWQSHVPLGTHRTKTNIVSNFGSTQRSYFSFKLLWRAQMFSLICFLALYFRPVLPLRSEKNEHRSSNSSTATREGDTMLACLQRRGLNSSYSSGGLWLSLSIQRRK